MYIICIIHTYGERERELIVLNGKRKLSGFDDLLFSFWEQFQSCTSKACWVTEWRCPVISHLRDVMTLFTWSFGFGKTLANHCTGEFTKPNFHSSLALPRTKLCYCLIHPIYYCKLHLWSPEYAYAHCVVLAVYYYAQLCWRMSPKIQ